MQRKLGIVPNGIKKKNNKKHKLFLLKLVNQYCSNTTLILVYVKADLFHI